MAYSFIHCRQVEFSETDMAGIVHFSHFFRWMEAAESGFFQSLNAKLVDIGEDEVRGWPRVRAQGEFHAPLYFQDQVEVHLFVKALKIRAIEYAFRFYRVTGDQREHVATGSMTTVCVSRPLRGGAMQSISLPESLLQQLSEAPPEALKPLRLGV